MAVPKFFSFFPYILRALSTGDTMHVKQIRLQAFDSMHLSDEDRSVLLPSGKQRMADNRVNWALTYLKKAGLVESPATGKYRITPTGKAALTEVGDDITLKYLEKFESFRQFHTAKPQDDQSASEGGNALAEGSPQDTMDNAFRQINEELATNLLQAIMENSPQFFEKLVVELLLKMGYGGAFEEAGIAVGQSGDEGIDGIIREDKLGFSSIYIQAKRWSVDTTVGRPEVQKFVGALAGQGAQKGLFITTAQFTKDAKNYVGKQSATKVVLVDGEKLAKLMIEYDVGVSTLNTYPIKKIDSDFFDEDTM